MSIILQHILYFALLNLGVILLGYVIIKNQKNWQSWALMVLCLLVIYLLFLHDHPVVKMLALIATTFTCMKIIAVTGNYKGKTLTLTFKQWAVFAGGWAGMRAQPFETLGAPPLPGAWPLIRFGITRVFAGAILVFLAHKTVTLPLNHGLVYFLTSAELLIGLSLILHFGLLSISAGTWRLSGVNTYLLFKQPAKAMSLTNFWSKRWNVALVK
jgi:alginate O-acetyltransferase complex protein AlgI